MFALQTNPSQLKPPIVALVVFIFLGALIGTLGSVVVQRLSNPVGKYRFLYAFVLLPVTLLAYGLLTILDFGTTLVTSPLDLSGVFSVILADFLEFLGAGLVWLGAYAPTVRGIREVRGIDLPIGSALVRMACYVTGLSVVVTVAIAPLRFTSSVTSPFANAVSFALLILIVVVGSPWIIKILRPTHRPTGTAAERIAILQDRADLDVRDAVVIDTDDEETPNALIRGPPGYRHLFITSTFLDQFDDTTATVLLAVRAGRLRSYVLTCRIATVIVGGFTFVATLTGMGPLWILLGLTVGITLIGFWLSRRGIRAGYDYAADRVGPATVAEALERYAEVHAMNPARRWLPNPLSVNVALGDRIDRLRERAEA